MLDKILEQLAEKIINLDEATLTDMLPLYKKKMEDFEATQEWEKAVIIFFIINSVRVKNSLFNDNVRRQQSTKTETKSTTPLKLVKS